MLLFPSHKALEEQCFEAFTPPVHVCTLAQSDPVQGQHGLIFASPHSGRTYPKAFTRRSRLPLAALRRNEDAYIDSLIRPLSEQGFPVLLANFPRCFVDVNRAPDELLPSWTGNTKDSTPRAAAGLGVVPTVIAEHLPIYKSGLPLDVVKARLDWLYHPYHLALKNLMTVARSRAGTALLLDCHSMPGKSFSGRARHDIILGDRFGTSAHPDFVHIAEQVFKSEGYSVTRNYPYAGGYVTSTYGQPDNGSHVIQIEINRQLYINPGSFRLTPGFKALQACFVTLANRLRPLVLNEFPRAAE